jgi:putative SOS response-associated peptidase YedK
MCFSVNVNLVKEELENRYGATFLDPDKYRPSYYYHAFGLPEIPTICSGRSDRIQLMKWGLIPSWVTNTENANEIRYKTFNARSESIDNKQSFSDSFRSKRCLIPVKGFFEWQHTRAGKIPWYIHSANDDIISFAGLWDTWIESRTGEIISTFSIITTDANDLMAVIHNSKKRMPVILDKTEEFQWLNLSIGSSEALKMLKPCPSDILKAHTISPLINNKTADRNSPELIKHYLWKTDDTIF